ncbi:MAG: glycosyltransferase family 2 protein [Bacteroidaceae bacterium]|nr:glycosyltransferase family 2 protein [Bacteroidaceae bacterium]
MTSLVTIGIPAFKAARLGESIASALSQTYGNIEVVVVNDKSPDDVDSVIERFNDSRLHYVVNERNLGAKDPTANWNECLRHARGEFFCLLCDDDVYAPTFIEELMKLSQRYPNCNVFRSGVCVVDDEGNEVTCFPASPEWEPVDDYMWHIYRGLRRQTISEFMLRRSVMDKVGGYVSMPYAWGSDYLSIFTFAGNTGIASTGKRLMTFRDSGFNLSSDQKNMDEKLLAFKEYIIRTKQLLLDLHSARADKILPFIDIHYRNAIVGHMIEADKKTLLRIITHRKRFDVTIGVLLRYILRKTKMLKG